MNVLIKFMKEKSKVFPKPELYFNDKDAEFLNTIDNNKIKDIWKIIKDAVYNEDAEGLGYATCPFCILFVDKDCNECFYAKNHGECGEDDNDLVKADMLNDPYNIISNKQYREIITKIEGGQNV